MEIFGWIVVAIIVGIPLLGVVLYNKLVSLRNQVKNAWRQIDVVNRDMVVGNAVPLGQGAHVVMIGDNPDNTR